MPVYKRNPLFRATSTTSVSTIANTSTATDFSLVSTIKANSLRIGKTINWRGRGVYSSLGSSAGTEAFTFKANATTIGTQAAFTVSLGKTNAMFAFDILITSLTLGATGTIEAQGTLYNETGNGSLQLFSLENSVPITIDTTVDQVLKLNFQWSVADPANTISLRQMVVEELG